MVPETMIGSLGMSTLVCICFSSPIELPIVQFDQGFRYVKPQSSPSVVLQLGLCAKELEEELSQVLLRYANSLLSHAN